MTAPSINVHTFPYRLQWTQEMLDDVLARFDAIKDALTDIVGPSGAPMYVDPSIAAVQALHLALAGGHIDEDRALIESRLRPDARGMFEHTREWRVKGSFADDDVPISREEVDARVEELRADMRKSIDPEVLDALQEKLADEYRTDARKANKRGKRVAKEGE